VLCTLIAFELLDSAARRTAKNQEQSTKLKAHARRFGSDCLPVYTFIQGGVYENTKGEE